MVLPTIESGRRVTDALLEDHDLIFPPLFATPLTLVPFGKNEGIATPAQAGMAWHAALSEAKDCPLTFGDHPGTKLAGNFVTLTRDLAAAEMNIPAAAKILSARDPRWIEWRALWESYMSGLAYVGLRCPAEAQIEAARNFSPPSGVTKILVAGVADLPPLALRAITNCDAEILIHAPGLEDGAFDESGRARPAFWSHAPLAIADSQIRVVNDPAELGHVISGIESAGRMAIICGEAGLSSDISCALEESGREGFLPEGYPLNRHPVTHLAKLIARLPGDGSWTHLEVLIFHPDFSEWLGDLLPNEPHKNWNRLGEITFCPSLSEIAERLRHSRTIDDEPSRKSLLAAFTPLLEKLAGLQQSMSSPFVAPVLREILADIYGPRDMGQRPGDKEAAKAVIALLDEISAFPSLAAIDAAALLTMLESVSGTWTPPHEPGAVEIEGWLELAGEDAPTLVLAGLNEGLLPTKRRVDSLLPDAARSALGLDDDVNFVLQRESGRLRLEEFAIAQANLRTEGWKTELVEWKFSGVTPPDWPLALKGRIDRVDVREGEMLLIDYKTGGLGKINPARSAHLKRARTRGRFGNKPEYAVLGNDVWCDLQLPLYATAVSLARPIDVPEKIRLAYFLIADDVTQTGLCEWTDADQQSATRCALGVAQEVADDAVLDWIAAKDFSRFAVDPDHDDFESLALSRLIEEGALIV